MPRHVYSLTWQGKPYRFFRLRDAAEGGTTEWAVARAGEFIGTMPCEEVTTQEFEVRCVHWLSELLGAPGSLRGH
jgi:hypothetical protein